MLACNIAHKCAINEQTRKHNDAYEQHCITSARHCVSFVYKTISRLSNGNGVSIRFRGNSATLSVFFSRSRAALPSPHHGFPPPIPHCRLNFVHSSPPPALWLIQCNETGQTKEKQYRDVVFWVSEVKLQFPVQPNEIRVCSSCGEVKHGRGLRGAPFDVITQTRGQ